MANVDMSQRASATAGVCVFGRGQGDEINLLTL